MDLQEYLKGAVIETFGNVDSSFSCFNYLPEAEDQYIYFNFNKHTGEFKIDETTFKITDYLIQSVYNMFEESDVHPKNVE